MYDVKTRENAKSKGKFKNSEKSQKHKNSEIV